VIDGAMWLAGVPRQAATRFSGVNPATGEPLSPDFSSSGADDVNAAAVAAHAAFSAFAASDPELRATLLEAIATRIVELGDTLIERAMLETALPRSRLEGERGRTTNQLRLFAEVVRQGEWRDVTLDEALPNRLPLPRPELLRVNVPLGPVAVFGASNFPLAFSVAGGDTCSALAAGCPVVVKGHPSHPGTGELVARAVVEAVAACGLPPGVFAYLPGETHELGGALVAHALIKAVGFTGSRAGGLALMHIAAARAEPIPVYAEMSSINPVLLFPGALAAAAPALAEGLVQSMTTGAGQLCTSPGLVLALDGPELEEFVAAAARALAAIAPATMLSPSIRENFEAGVERLSRHPAVRLITRSGHDLPEQGPPAALFATKADDFLNDPALQQEVFGACALVVRCADLDQLRQVVASLEGQLTATLHAADDDHADAARLLPLIVERVGRVIFNGWPTGVEVCAAMVHGGPFPATSDGRSTSVGTLAIRRFLRPVAVQNAPLGLLASSDLLRNLVSPTERVGTGYRMVV
jgi:2,5-dioxopentanoate dehydrogenase